MEAAGEVAAYVAPPVLVMTAALYLIASVMDYMGDQDYKVVYIAGAALWLVGQIIVAVVSPLLRRSATEARESGGDD